MADDAARAGPSGDHRLDLSISADLNRRVERWMARLPARTSKSEAIRVLLTRGLDYEGVPV